MNDDDEHIIIGVNNIDNEMKHKKALEILDRERETFARVTALTGDYLSFYTVDPDTEEYVEYNASNSYKELGLSTGGRDFFALSRKEAVRAIYPGDLDMFLSEFSKEKVLDAVRQNGIFVIQYRLMIKGEPKYVNLKAALVEEKGKQKIVIGVNDVDDRVRRDLEYSQRMSELGCIDPAAMASEEMKFQCIVDHTAKPCAVLSVETREDGSVGDIRIVRANNAYKESMGPA